MVFHRSHGLLIGIVAIAGRYAPDVGGIAGALDRNAIAFGDLALIRDDSCGGSVHHPDGVLPASAIAFGDSGGHAAGRGTYCQTIGCMAGRSGDEIDRLMISSTGPR